MASDFTAGTLAIRCREMATSLPFYRRLLGEEMAASIEQDGAASPCYTAWFALRDGGRLVLTDSPHSHPPVGGSGVHLLVDDPAAEEARLGALGITSLLPTHETKGGYALVLADPDGNEIVIGTAERLPGIGTKLPF